MLLFVLLGCNFAHSQFPGNDNTVGVGKTFNVPVGVTSVTASAWGGGGGGGGCNNSGSGGNGGGGGGAVTNVINVIGGTTTFTYTVGNFGAAGASGGGTGGNGTLSSITCAVPLISMTANGGTGGLGNALALNTPTNSGGGSASGGTTSAGTNGTRGGASGQAGGNSGTVISIFGAGGLAITDNSGNPGGTPGGGGGGGERSGGTSYAGGAGGVGRVSFHYIGVTGISPSPACIGGIITITGFGFTSGVTTITIGGTACTSVTYVNSTTITAVVGVGTSSGTVVVTNPNGTNNGQTLTVNPALTTIAGGAASVCVGANTPAFTNVTGGGTWSTISGTGSATINSSGIATGVTAGTVTVVYTVSGCTTTTALTVVNPPAAIAGGATSVCTGLNTVAFTNATGGGTWSIANITGSATITSGGIATGVTAGTVNVVYTVGSCSVTKALTINQTPSAIGGGAASVCTGATTPAFTNTFAGGTWSITNGTGSATISVGGVVTGVTAGNVTVNYTISPCTVATVALTVNAVPSASITPSPTTGATGVCYAGTGPITSVSWAATALATSYDIYFGAGALPGTVTSNVLTNSYSTGTLLASTTYYWRVVAKNGCGDATSSATWTFTTAGTPCAVYCTPTASSGMDGTGITNVSYSTVNNTTSNTIVYNDYTSFVGNAVQGSAMPISVTTSTGNKRYNIKIWVDWNSDSDFLDAGEEMFAGTVKSNTINGIINIPLAATLGNHRMRVGITIGHGNTNEPATPCFTGTKGAFEDYILNITAAAGCTIAPTVTTSPSSVSIASGANTSFTAVFGNSPTSYVWEVSTDGGINFTPITNGGVYTNATTATLNLTAVTYAMNGFMYRVSATNACGTSAYTTSATLTVSTSTYCSPTHTVKTSHWIATVFSDGNLKDTSYSGTPIYSATGYNDYSSTIIARQSPGGGLNISFILGSTQSGPSLNRSRVACFVDWNSDGDFTDSGELVYSSGTTGLLESTFGIIIPVTTNPGNYRMRLRTQQTGAITDPCITLATGETEDYTISIVPDCAAKIESVINGAVCGTTNPVTLTAVGLGGTTKYRWYTTETGGSYVETLTGTYSPTPGVTTAYYVTAFNGSCESLVRTRVVAKVTPTANIVFSPTNPITCEEDTVITISAASDQTEIELFYEDFEEGHTVGMTATTGTPYTLPGADSPWQVKTSTYQSTTTAVWKPSINSGSVDNNFAFTSSDYNSCNIVTRYTTTAAFDTTDFISLNLSFNMYFSYYEGVSGQNFKVQISPDNGGNWNDLTTYTADLGVGSRFTTVNLSIPNTPTSYLNLTQVKIRFQFTSGVWTDGVAIDNIRFYGIKQLNTTFSWSSSIPVSGYTDLACTTLYTNQVLSTIYLRPTLTQLEATDFPISVTATLANGCPITQDITVANNARVWKGLDVVDATNWNDVDNWRPAAIPTIDNCVIIPNTSIVKGTAYQAFAKNLVVKPTGNLNIQPGNSITVKEWVNVDDAAGGIFDIENTASLVQVDNVASNNNTGKINYKRNASLKRYDYTYLSAPVEGHVVDNVTQSPLVSGPIYRWNPTIANPNNGQGNWEYASGNTMTAAKGYAVRSPDSFPFTATTFNGLFKGRPNNGIITTPISRGSDQNTSLHYGTNGTEIDNFSDNWNLIGNPYASSIRGNQFLVDNSTKIEGNIRLWTHNIIPNESQPQPYYGSFVYNYDPNDYLTYNYSGTTCCPLAGPEIFIGAGQGFFVQMKDGAAASDVVTFNNTLRSANYDNSYFFKNSNQSDSNIDVANLERNRMWLDIVNSSNQSVRILVGYIEGATMDRDSFFDANGDIGGALTFYSLIGNAKLSIQGRALPFDTIDEVPLGFRTITGGNFSIAIAAVDGLFTTQNVYIKDTLLNTINDIKSAPYHFTSAVGQFDDRFKIVYTNSALGNPDFGLENTVKVVSNDAISVQSTKEPIDSIVVYDILGRTLGTYKSINSNEFTIRNLLKNNTTLLLQIKLQNGAIVNQKVMY